MSGISRQKLLTELSAISLEAGTNSQVKQNLEITDFDPAPILLDIEELQTDIATISGAISNIDFDTTDIETDIENIDISFTKKIAEECLLSSNPPVTGSDTTIIGYLTITINGVEYKLALV
jgi:hypothetical protein